MNMQMNIKKIATLGLLAMLPLTAVQAAPEVKSVTFDYNGNKAKETNFQVKYSNGNFQSLTQSVVMSLGEGNVTCARYKEFSGAKLYLGSPVYANNSIAANGAYVKDTSGVSVTTSGAFNTFTEAPQAGGLTFQINLAQVNKQVFDPVQVVKDELAKAKGQGMSEVDFLKQDRLFQAKRKVTLAGRCYGNLTNAAKGWEIDQKNVSFMVQYKGDPTLGTEPGLDVHKPLKVVPVSAVPVGGEGGFEQGKINLKVTEGTLLTSSLNYNLNCPANLDFSVKYKGLGKGLVTFHVVEGNQTVYESAPSSYDAADGWVQKNFKVNVPATPENMNQKVQRKFRLFFKVRDVDGNSFDWSAPGNYQGLNWSHTCKPQVAVPMGQGGISYGPANPAPGTQVKALPANPQPPVMPGSVRPQPLGPSPKAPLTIIVQPAAPQAPARKVE